MASENKNLRADLRNIVDEVAALRNAYVRLQSYIVDQERLLVREQEKSMKLQARLKLAINTLLTLKDRFKAAWDRTEREKESLAENVKDLQRMCDQFRSSIAADQYGQDRCDSVFRLVQEPTQRAQLAFQGKNEHRKPTCDDDVLRKSEKNTIELGMDYSSVHRAKRRRTKKPALSDYTPADGASCVADVNRRKSRSNFRWPSLNVTITGGNGALNDDDIRGTRSADVGAGGGGNGGGSGGINISDVDDGANGNTHGCRASNGNNKWMKSLSRMRKLYSDNKEDAIDI